MAYQVDWEAGIITIPKADLVFLSADKYKLDLYEFAKECWRLTWETTEGLSYPEIITYYPAVDTGDVILGKTILINHLDYMVVFEDGQYAVLFDGANTNLHNYTIVNQVSIRPNNSAGLQDLSTLLSMAYNSMVVVDELRGQSGTATPIGTLAHPSNNIPDAVEIANKHGIGKLLIIGTIDLVDDVSDLIVMGQNSVLTTINVLDEALTLNTTFKNATLNGILDGNSTVEDCSINDLYYVNGNIYYSVLNEGTITLGGNATAILIGCVSGVPGSDTPIIDCGGSGQALAIRDFNGGMKLINKTGIDPTSLDFNSGQLKVDDTVTNGTIYVRGTVGKVTDNSTGNAVVDISGVMNRETISEAVWEYTI